jgi:hypothetical protein
MPEKTNKILLILHITTASLLYSFVYTYLLNQGKQINNLIEENLHNDHHQVDSFLFQKI